MIRPTIKEAVESLSFEGARYVVSGETIYIFYRGNWLGPIYVVGLSVSGIRFVVSSKIMGALVMPW